MNFTYLITAVSIIGTLANIHKKRWCFVVWLFTNSFWFTYDFAIGQYSQSILFAVYFALSVVGLIKWKKKAGGRKDGRIHSNRNFRYSSGPADNRSVCISKSRRS